VNSPGKGILSDLTIILYGQQQRSPAQMPAKVRPDLGDVKTDEVRNLKRGMKSQVETQNKIIDGRMYSQYLKIWHTLPKWI